MATETETKMVAAINALSLFTKVRYIVAESDSEILPTELPLCIISDLGRDFSIGRTFCGVDLNVFIQQFSVLIIADTAAQVRSLSTSVIGALADIVTISDTIDTFDDELAAFVSELTFTT